jgi:hypothetical protein
MLPSPTHRAGTPSVGWLTGRPSGLRRSLLPVLSGCCTFLATCSNQPSGPEQIPVVQLSEHEATLGVGDWIHLHLLPVLPPGYVPPVTWSSTNPETATVESVEPLVGEVRGLSPGQTVVLVAGEGASDSAVVIVLPPEPAPSVTLLVTNATCSSSQCSSFQVRGLPRNLPPVPAGPRSLDLGTVTMESACLTVPAADTFWIGETPTVWTSNNLLSLALLEPGEFWGFATPSTSAFVPASSAGWRVTLPGDTAVTPSGVCR